MPIREPHPADPNWKRLTFQSMRFQGRKEGVSAMPSVLVLGEGDIIDDIANLELN